MTMSLEDVEAAVEDAKRTINKADKVVEKVAYLCCGRLRSARVSAYYLRRLKRELRDFNMHTGRWNA